MTKETEAKIINMRRDGLSYNQISLNLSIPFHKVRVVSEANKLNGSVKNISAEKFQQELNNLGNGEYKLLSEYKNTTTHVTIKHKTCGYMWTVQPRSFLQGSRCPICMNNKRRLTHESFIAKLEQKKPGEYKVISKYVDYNTNIKAMCKKCGEVIDQLPGNFLQKGRECKGCAREEKRLSRERAFKAKLNNALGEGYELVSKYENSISAVEIKHSCGFAYEVLPVTITQHKYGKCPECEGGIRKYSKESFVDELFKQYGEEYSMLGDFKNLTTKTLFRHNDCGFEFYKQPGLLIGKNKQGCPACSYKKAGESLRLSHDEFKIRVMEALGPEYEIIGAYKTTEDKVEMRHSVCGKTYESKANHIMRGHGCPYCNSGRKDAELARQRLFETRGSEYAIIGEYINGAAKLTFKHTKCGKAFKASYSDIINQKAGCPHCKESRGEEKIRAFLESKGIRHEQQYKDDRCRNVRALRFDFACFDSKEQLACLIEFDGLQHDNSIEYFGGDDGYKYRRKLDAIKDSFCVDNNINLIRIKYSQMGDVEKILGESLANTLTSQ